jgi:hypothetical protein
MFRASIGISTLAIAALAYFGQAPAQAADQPNMSGSYRCGPDMKSCQWSGDTFTVTQTGNNLAIKNEKGALGSATLTSAITISAGPPWNMLGVISNGDRQIDWSNGTQWRKQ